MKKRIASFLLTGIGVYYFILLAFIYLTPFLPLVVRFVAALFMLICAGFLVISLIHERGIFFRLSPYFIALNIFPFRCSIISQKPKKQLCQLECNAVYHELHKENFRLPNKLKANWHYIAVTHETVIERLKKSDRIDASSIKMVSCGKSNLLVAQNELMKGRCKKCPSIKRAECRFRSFGQIERSFYIVLFRTKPE